MSQGNMQPSLEDARRVLRSRFGHSQFRSLQQDAIECVLGGRHALVIMPTGMGKSLCFQIPALTIADRDENSRRPLTLVLSPLIALMKDQVDSLIRKGVDASFVNSSLTRKERLQRYESIDQGRFELLYVAPERFRKPDFCEIISRRKIALLAVDEAHCVSEWGHDFRPDYTRVGEIRQQLGSPTTVALTATATPDVQRDIVRQLQLEPDAVTTFHAGIDRPNLSLAVKEVWDDDEKLEALLQTRSELEGSGIAYFNLIRKLREFSQHLWSRNIPHLVYHGDLDRDRRREIQESFMQEPGHLVLATNAFGMGVDKEDIRFVVHVDLPDSVEAYYQEIGRAGRDGKPSQCQLLFDQRDLATQMEFLEWSNPGAEYYQRLYYHLQQESEQINAFGLEWLRERMHAKQKHDRRLETALGMLHRWGALEGSLQGKDLQTVAPLPEKLADAQALDDKKRRDQLKLLAMVQYVQFEGDRKSYIHDYFGLSKES